MKARKKATEIEVLKVGSIYKLVKVYKKLGHNSGIPVGATRKIKLSEIPQKGSPIKGQYDSEHPLSGEPKVVYHPVSSPIIKMKNIPEVGLQVETFTSIYLILY